MFDIGTLPPPNYWARRSFDVWSIGPSVRGGALALIAPRSVADFAAMTILVTVGAGFIANTLVDSIRSRGDSVICLDNLCRGTSANVARFTDKNSFRFSTVDLADLDAFRSCLGSHEDFISISDFWDLACNFDIP
jgi:hypothetical protein